MVVMQAGGRAWPSEAAAPVQALRFVMVGALAAATHWVAAVIAMVWLAPLVANVVGFCCAFPVSFAGHFHWSFRGRGALWVHALPRFVLVALSSFGANELLYAALLRFTPWHPRVSLVVTLLAVAASTFVLSRGWAFARRH
jgi:putative flippase GtrA